jgi:TldD protein
MKDMLKEIVARAKADYAEIRVEDSLLTQISYKGRALENISESADFGGCVRVLVRGGWGFVSFNRLDELEKKIAQAIEQATLISHHVNRATKLAPVKVVEDAVSLATKRDPRKISLKEKKQILEGYNDIILSYDPLIGTSSISYFDKYSRLRFANSEGTYIEQEKLDLGGAVVAIASRGGETQMGHFPFGSSDDFGVLVGKDEEVRKACEIAVGLLEAKSVKGGEYTVIVDPVLAGVFAHEAFGHLSEGDNVYEDKNLQKLMQLGETYGSSILNIYDTGIEAGYRGYLKYDDEGVPTEKTYLIKNGKLVSRLHSRETAGVMGEKPTGNARAMSYRHAPICRMRNTCIQGGKATFEDMLKGIKLGVYAKDSYGGQTSHEMFTFSAGEAHMIRDGKITELVKDVTLSGNVFHTLKNIDMIGNDFAMEDSGGGCGKGGQTPLPVSHGSPHIRISKVIVGGRK